MTLPHNCTYAETNRPMRWLAAAIFVAGLLGTSALAQTNDVVLAVRGAVGQPLALALSDLRAMPPVKLKAREKDGGEVMFEGVALSEVVSRAKPKLGGKGYSNLVNKVIVIKAADNYQAVFSLAEIDPKFGDRQILLADLREGLPLTPQQGPLKIIVPDDKVHARWVRQVNLIEVLSVGDLGRASTNSMPP